MAEEIIGTIFTKEEADKNYGEVLSSVEINSSQFSSLFNETNRFVMFNIKEEKLYLLGDGRALLYSDGSTVGAEELFAVYSKSKVNELLETGREEITIIEKRNEVITLTNGQFTLEMGAWCPPFCGTGLTE